MLQICILPVTVVTRLPFFTTPSIAIMSGQSSPRPKKISINTSDAFGTEAMPYHTKERSFTEDCKYTVVQLSRHLVDAATFSVRLYSLPLIHIFRALSEQRHKRSRKIHMAEPTFPSLTRLNIRTRLRLATREVNDCIHKFFAVLRALWMLGRLLESNSGILANKQRNGCDETCTAARRVKNLSVSSVGSSDEGKPSPTRASDIYDAALANSGKLSQLLEVVKLVKSQRKSASDISCGNIVHAKPDLGDVSSAVLSKPRFEKCRRADKATTSDFHIGSSQSSPGMQSPRALSPSSNNALTLCTGNSQETDTKETSECAQSKNSSDVLNIRHAQSKKSSIAIPRCSVYEQKHQKIARPQSRQSIRTAKHNSKELEHGRGSSLSQYSDKEERKMLKSQSKAR